MQLAGKVDGKVDAKNALLRAAKTLFAAKGYQGVSTREIADSAGVNLGAIQYHYGSKLKLFLAAVYDLMHESACARHQLLSLGEITSPLDGGKALHAFVHHFVGYLLAAGGAEACRITLREILGSASESQEVRDALVTSFVKDFIAPVDERLVTLLGAIAPESDSTTRELCAQSVIGQCLFYLTHGPFIARLRGLNGDGLEALTKVSNHITAFSLQGMGWNKAEVDLVLKDEVTVC